MLKTAWAIIGLVLAITGYAQSDNTSGSLGGLTAEEAAIESPLNNQQQLSPIDRPISAREATDLQLMPLAQGGYSSPDGRLTVDVVENHNAFLAVQVTTPDGRPVVGARPKASIKGSSKLVDTTDALLMISDRYGIIELVVLGGQMGSDVVTVEIGDAKTEILLNVLSLAATTVPDLPTVDDSIPWQDLMQARVTYEGNVIKSSFPDVIAERNGKTVRIAGFMTPLQPDETQRWFILTSAPPHCFFDIPGGPAGTIEVLAPDGVDLAWEPVVIEGRLETIEEGDGTVYRLHEAQRVRL